MFSLVLVMLTMANISIALSQLTLGLALAILLGGWLRGALRPTLTGLEKPAFALAAWALLMIPFSGDPGQSALFYRRFYLFTALWVMASVADTSFRRRGLLIALAVGAVAISLFGQIHVYMQTGALFQTRLGEMSNPMTSGCLLMMSLLVLFGFLADGRCDGRSRLLMLAASLPVALGLLQTLTRSAWLGMLAGGLAILALVRPRLTALFLLLAVLVAVAIPRLPSSMVAPWVAERFSITSGASDRSGSERLKMWRGGWEMVRRNPVTGLGDHDLTAVAPQYYGDAGTRYYGHLHSNPVMLAAIWGVPGFLLACWFMGLPGWLLWRRWRRQPPDPWLRGWILAGVGVWVGFMVASLTEWYFGDAESMLLYLAILGVGLAKNGAAHG